MFCPQCGSVQPDELRFCKQCGANLAAVRIAALRPDNPEGFDWTKTWVADMLMSSDRAVKRKAEIDKLKGVTSETRRRNEIKGGVVTASTGLGLMILLYVLMQGIIAGGVSDKAVPILSSLWVVGVLPLLIGFAIIFNGAFISKRYRNTGTADENVDENKQFGEQVPDYLPASNPDEFFTTPGSVTDSTTKHLVKNRRD
jgi:hypothetical protein